jgi:hypothetical protein
VGERPKEFRLEDLELIAVFLHIRILQYIVFKNSRGATHQVHGIRRRMMPSLWGVAAEANEPQAAATDARVRKALSVRQTLRLVGAEIGEGFSPSARFSTS